MKKLMAMLIVCLLPALSQAYTDPSTSLDPDGSTAANDIEAKCETAMPNFMSDKPRKEKQREFSRHAACVKSNFGAHIMKGGEYKKTKLKKDICMTDKELDKAQKKSGMGALKFYATYRWAKEKADQNKQARKKYEHLYGVWLIGDSQDCDTQEFRQHLYDLTITDFYCSSADFYAPLENRKPECPWKK